MNKKYYWLKLKDDFFEDETIKFIEEQENGIKYSNFYLKLCLKSLKTEGKLIRLIGETLIPYDINSLSKLTFVDVDTVRCAMALFEKIGLIKILESGEIYLSQINEMIGKETEKAKYMRDKRAKEKQLLEQKGNNVPKCYTEIDIKRIDIEKDINIYNNIINNNIVEHDEIINYLNQKANTNFRSTTKNTIKLINGLLKKGYTVEDFKNVIDIKCSKWLYDAKMNEFLRPTTLFAESNFENYLNQYKKSKENIKEKETEEPIEVFDYDWLNESEEE